MDDLDNARVVFVPAITKETYVESLSPLRQK